MERHYERCKECKKRIHELLIECFGDVKKNYNLRLSNRPDSFSSNSCFSDLNRIFIMLQDYRGYKEFVRSKRLPNVDFFAMEPGVIIELDESQHFTFPRMIALKEYPSYLELGFDRKTWIELCTRMSRKDNAPPYRDEQRAWYDTLRDFAPYILDLKPTMRLFAKESIWCELDLDKFKTIIGDKNATHCLNKYG
jgi:hypothetical protein